MKETRPKVPSQIQKNILRFIDRYQGKYSYPPTLREIRDDQKISSTSVVDYHLKRLLGMGLLEKTEGVSRGIRLCKSPELRAILSNDKPAGPTPKGNLYRIPKLGRIVAGEPLPAPTTDFSVFGHDSVVEVSAGLLASYENRSDSLYALEVHGDSMIDALVSEGDIIILKPVSEVRNGEMVAARLNDRDETTLKYFYLEHGRVRLQPANPTMKPILINDPSTVDVQGKVVLVIRKVG